MLLFKNNKQHEASWLQCFVWQNKTNKKIYTEHSSYCVLLLLHWAASYKLMSNNAHCHTKAHNKWFYWAIKIAVKSVHFPHEIKCAIFNKMFWCKNYLRATSIVADWLFAFPRGDHAWQSHLNGDLPKYSNIKSFVIVAVTSRTWTPVCGSTCESDVDFDGCELPLHLNESWKEKERKRWKWQKKYRFKVYWLRSIVAWVNEFVCADFRTRTKENQIDSTTLNTSFTPNFDTLKKDYYNYFMRWAFTKRKKSRELSHLLHILVSWFAAYFRMPLNKCLETRYYALACSRCKQAINTWPQMVSETMGCVRVFMYERDREKIQGISPGLMERIITLHRIALRARQCCTFSSIWSFDILNNVFSLNFFFVVVVGIHWPHCVTQDKSVSELNWMPCGAMEYNEKMKEKKNKFLHSTI